MNSRKCECKVCGKELQGISFDYGSKWACSNCSVDKQSVLYCERGCQVQAVNIDCGLNFDSEQAKKYLEKDKIYTSKQVCVGGYSSTIELEEIPNQKFNTVHFIRV